MSQRSVIVEKTYELDRRNKACGGIIEEELI